MGYWTMESYPDKEKMGTFAFCNSSICNNMDEPGGDYAKQNTWEREHKCQMMLSLMGKIKKQSKIKDKSIPNTGTMSAKWSLSEGAKRCLAVG